ncbi:MAG: hypothetical protein J7L95_07865, partial [Prolixibacteraceae bacterium]|nr:hypothetical protein [Prolixibacteraceae bacterium]
LPGVLAIQNAPFEVVAVDDFSQDNSLSVLGVLKEKTGKLTVSSLSQETRFSEKLAQNIGLKGAKKNWVMIIPPTLTDYGDEWLKFISERLENNRTVVVNYSNVTPARNFFNHLFRIENFLLQWKSMGYILNGLPFVYNEENVAFRKEKYFETGGYGKYIKEPFANLELLINRFIRKRTTTINFSDHSAIRHSVEVGKKEYFELLKKSFRIEKHLSFIKRVVLFFDEFTKILLLPVTVVAVVSFFQLWPFFAGLFGLKILLQLVIIKVALNRLNERKIFISSFLYDGVMPYFKIVYRWAFNRRRRKQKWKNKA